MDIWDVLLSKNLRLHNLSRLLKFDFSSDKQCYNYNTHVH